MTNAIEQAKRNMYYAMSRVKTMIAEGIVPNRVLPVFEENLEEYLELLRQDHEALHETARARFEDIGKLWEANADLTQRLAKMTEERDSIQLRLHAVDHAYKTQQERTATPTQDSGDRASCEATGVNAAAIQGAAEDIRKISDAWAMSGRRAKKSMLKISGILARPDVYAALEAIEKPATCMHSFHALPISRDDKTEICVYCGIKKECQHSFFAIGDDQMKCTFCGVGK